MHGLHTCTLHNSESLEPLTWTRVCPSVTSTLFLSLVHTCFVLSLLNISKYMKFKLITRVVLSCIDLATYLTLKIWNARPVNSTKFWFFMLLFDLCTFNNATFCVIRHLKANFSIGTRVRGIEFGFLLKSAYYCCQTKLYLQTSLSK